MDKDTVLDTPAALLVLALRLVMILAAFIGFVFAAASILLWPARGGALPWYQSSQFWLAVFTMAAVAIFWSCARAIAAVKRRGGKARPAAPGRPDR